MSTSAAARQAGDERAVDLDHVDRQPLEVGQRRVAGAEIVDRDAQPPIPKEIDRLHRLLDVVHHGGPGDLDADMPAQSGGGAEHVVHLGDELDVAI
jgi:hypothetical protein